MTNKKYTRQAWARMRSPREGGRAGLWALCADGSALHAMPTRAWPCCSSPCAFEADAARRAEPWGAGPTARTGHRKLQGESEAQTPGRGARMRHPPSEALAVLRACRMTWTVRGALISPFLSVWLSGI